LATQEAKSSPSLVAEIAVRLAITICAGSLVCHRS
jgi:hypothetical protein